MSFEELRKLCEESQVKLSTWDLDLHTLNVMDALAKFDKNKEELVKEAEDLSKELKENQSKLVAEEARLEALTQSYNNCKELFKELRFENDERHKAEEFQKNIYNVLKERMKRAKGKASHKDMVIQQNMAKKLQIYRVLTGLTWDLSSDRFIKGYISNPHTYRLKAFEVEVGDRTPEEVSDILWSIIEKTCHS